MNTIRRIVEFAKVKTFAFKCIAIGAALALVASACVIQLASTQLIGGRQTAQAATANRTLTVTMSAKRGRILDANGSVLAQSVERYTIVANPEAAQEFEPITCNDNTRDYCHEIDGKPVGKLTEAELVDGVERAIRQQLAARAASPTPSTS